MRFNLKKNIILISAIGFIVGGQGLEATASPTLVMSGWGNDDRSTTEPKEPSTPPTTEPTEPPTTPPTEPKEPPLITKEVIGGVNAHAENTCVNKIGDTAQVNYMVQH